MKGNVARVISEAVRDECLSIEVTTHCDGHCRHCFALTGVARRASLGLDVVKQAVKEGYNSAYRRLHITGGEPLLWEGLFAALDYAAGVGYQKISLNTNGRFLTAAAARRFAAYPGLSISVSLEGPEVLHDRIRGDGSYKRTVAGIDQALEAGVDLAIFTVAGKSLLAVLPHFVDEVYQRFPGIRYLTLIQLIAATDNGFDLKEELLGPEEFLELVQTAGLLNLAGLRTNLKNSPLARVVSKLIGMPWVPPSYPLYRAGSLIVMANGNISLAHSRRDSLGQYAPGMIQQVLASDEYRRAVAPDRSTCPACKYSGLCRENGMLRPAARHMDLQLEAPYCKRVMDRAAG
jgi:MoaA/NifB/PqqE/SkfB family radical SAM enzyme